MAELNDKIRALAEKYHSEVRSVRRQLHAHPELSFQEYKTSEFIAARLTEYGISFKKGIVKTGIVALITGEKPGKCIALRADMDALPIQEKSAADYCSKHPGIMHACGHDVHMACLLGAARIIHELRAELHGSVKLIFQPGEEKIPGGASLMIGEGVLENPRPEAIVALHVFPSMETGRVGFRSGMYMASTDELYLTFRGKGGHAAMPADYINPLFIASAVLMELRNVFMIKKAGGHIPTVIAFGKIEGKGATNVIPESVYVEGTFRTLDENWRTKAHALMKEIAERKAREEGGNVEFRIEKGYPFLRNDEALTGRCREAAETYLGKEKVEDLPVRMTAEDFAFYTQHIPGCFFRLGTGNKSKGISAGVHTETFDIDEEALQTGVALLSCIALKS
ncbi:MAG: amidohydrolase [Bacteroidia bacterium]|nr:amidohydrolase [Bacteroidia bacterium]